MEPRRLVRVIYQKQKKYYLIVPSVTLDNNEYAYTFPVEKIESDSPEVLFDAIAEVMEKYCRLPVSHEWVWIKTSHEETGENIWVREAQPKPVFFDDQKFRKDFGYEYGNLVQTATSVVMMEKLEDESYRFEFWSTDGMYKERLECSGQGSRENIINVMTQALSKSEMNRAARPKFY